MRSVGVAMGRLLRVLELLLFMQHSFNPSSLLSAEGVEVPVPLFINSKGLHREPHFHLSAAHHTTAMAKTA